MDDSSAKHYDFDTVIDRAGTSSVKWDMADQFCGSSGVLPMWVADMDFRSPPEVIEALRRVAEHGIFGYTRPPDSYYQAVTGWMARRHGWTVPPEWVVLSPGVVPALHLIIRAFTGPGEQVAVQTPVYYPFFNAIKCHRAGVLDNPLRREDGRYRMDLDDLERQITPRTRLLILCSPHNPVSRVWTEAELRRLGELCLRNNILVVADEIHGDLVYPGHRHLPLASLSPELAENTIVCTSASKTFNLPGLHTSNIIIPNARLRRRFNEQLRGSGLFSANIFGVAATEAAYRYGEPWLEALLAYLQGNIAFLQGYVAQRIPGLKVTPPEGTYLLWLDFRDCGISPDKLGKFVREEARVGLEPGTLFGAKEEGFERMNIACPRAILAEGLGRLERAVGRLRWS